MAKKPKTPRGSVPADGREVVRLFNETPVGRALADVSRPMHAVFHIWRVRFPNIPFTDEALCDWLATQGINHVDAKRMTYEQVVAMLNKPQTEASPETPQEQKKAATDEQEPQLSMVVDLERMEVRFGDEVLPCKSERALRLLQVYLDNEGRWITDKAARNSDPCISERADKLKKLLPNHIQSLIESDRKLGSRLCLPQPSTR